MENINVNIEDLIVRFFNDLLEPAEEKILYTWLKESEKNRNRFFELRDIWLASGLINKDFNREKAWKLVTEKITAFESSRKKKRIERIIMTWASAAAVVALVLTLLNIFHIKSSELAFDSHSKINKVLSENSKKKIVLPDNSVVWLNKNAMLYYPDRFDGEKREVKMEGEVYFEVVKNEEKPFIVNFGDDQIKVIGTSFNVKNIIENGKNEIVLLTGSIELHLGGTERKITLKSNEKLSYSTVNKEVIVDPVDGSLYNVWTKDRLRFDNEKLSYVIANLEVWYGTKIECPKSLAEEIRVTFTIIDETEEQMLKSLSKVAPIKYRLEKGKMFIFPK